MGRRWRLGDAPACQLTPDRALAATIALLPDLVEQKGRDVLALSPPPGQIRQVGIEGGRPLTTRTEEISSVFHTSEAANGLAIQLYATGDGADGQPLRQQRLDLGMALGVPLHQSSRRDRRR